MIRHFCVFIFPTILFFTCETETLASRIGIESYEAQKDQLSGEVKSWGQKIILRDFDVELPDRIQNIPIFSIQYEGLHHSKGNGVSRVEARAKCIAERLLVAFDLLSRGGTLVIDKDNWETSRLTRSTAPPYPPAPESYPALYINHPDIGNNPLRIMTIYPQDADALLKMPMSEDSVDWWDENDLALYMKALIQAHSVLFFEKSNDFQKYEHLSIDQTREGKMFKEVFIRAKDVMNLTNRTELLDDVLKDTLARIAMPQRQRLVNMAFVAPRDWTQE